MPAVTALLFDPQPGVVHVEPLVVNSTDLDALAAEIAVQPNALRWLRHGAHLLLGSATGAAATVFICPAHAVTIRGRTLLLELDAQHISSPTPLDHCIDLREEQSALRYFRAVGTKACDEGTCELRPITQPLHDLEASEPTNGDNLSAALEQALGVRARVLHLQAGDDPIERVMQMLAEAGAVDSMMQLQVELPFEPGKRLPTSLDFCLHTVREWLHATTEGMRDHRLPPATVRKHLAFSKKMVNALEAFLTEHRAEYEELGGDFEAITARPTSDGDNS